MSSNADADGPEPIAIIGLSCKFAGDARNPAELWQMLVNGRNAWSEVPSLKFTSKPASSWLDLEEFDVVRTCPERGFEPDEDVALFDANFFNLSSDAAAALDPQFRMQLESVYEALENAGLPMDRVAGTDTSVFAALWKHDYRDGMIRDGHNLPRSFELGTGGAFAANRISHFFDLHGASMTIDTACSTALVALHQAVQSLRNRESSMSIIGGSNIMLNPDTFKAMDSAGFLSGDGKCFSFDSRANGYGRGEGVATIIIKRLKDAVAAGDPVRAIIRNTLLNQDGKTESITSPSQSAQAALMRDCYNRARLDPRDTQYFEAHGTGTPVGDPIETSAIASVFKAGSLGPEPLYIGSVKTNIGHTEVTSGLAGIIKVILAMENGTIPPSVNFEQPNANIALESAGLKVVTTPTEWKVNLGGFRRASVNSFGYGGTNAHVIIESADSLPQISPPPPSLKYKTKVLVLSAKSEAACQTMVSSLRTYLSARKGGNDEAFLQNVIYTLTERRSHLSWVAACRVPFSQGIDEVTKALDTSRFKPVRTTRQPRLGMIFTGQGAQWNAMGRELIIAYPPFKKSLEEAEGYLKEFGAEWSLLEELHRDAETTRVNDTALSIPICVALQIGLVILLRSWGVLPTAVTSHSSGEIAAAFAVGCLSFRSAMAVAYYRAALSADKRIRNGTVQGGMVAIGAGLRQTESYLKRLKSGGKALVACINSPSSVTVAGDVSSVEEIEALAKSEGVFARRLRVDTAYHSHHMESTAGPYRESLCRENIAAESNCDMLGPISFSSPVTGGRIASTNKIAQPSHWIDSLLQPVRFVEAVTDMVLGDNDPSGSSIDVIIEVGPHSALGGPIKEILALPEFKHISIPYFNCLSRKVNARDSMQDLVANLIREGYQIDLGPVNFPWGRWAHVRAVTDLPSYPWDHKIEFWHESRVNKALRERCQVRHPLLGSLEPWADLKAPSWRRIFRFTEFPWLKDYAVRSQVVYPDAAFICHAIDAMTQWHTMLGHDHSRYGCRLRDINFLQPLSVPENTAQIEIRTSLTPSRNRLGLPHEWTRFSVSSLCSGEDWTEHANGMIQIDSDGACHFQRRRADSMVMKSLVTNRHVDGQDFYKYLRSVGIMRGPAFQNIKKFARSKDMRRSEATFLVEDASVSASTHSGYLQRIRVLDATFQAAYTSLSDTRVKHDPAKMLSSISNLYVSDDLYNELGKPLKARSLVQHYDAQDMEVDIFVSDETSAASSGKELLSIHGMSLAAPHTECVSSNGPSEQIATEQCSRAQWAPHMPLEIARYLTSFNRELQDTVSFQHKGSYDNLASILQRLVHKYPRSNIIEIGAGNSGATRSALEALGTSKTGGPMAACYHFTSTSATSLEMAAASYEPWSGIMKFSRLDIERDPSTQGFEAGSYDVAIAARALHSSKDVAGTLTNMRTLLKPGGAIFIVESIQTQVDTQCGEGVLQDPTGSSFGASTWDDMLRNTGFTGTEIEVNSPESGSVYSLSTMVSTALSPWPNVPNTRDIMIVISDRCPPQSSWLEALKSTISTAMSFTGTTPAVACLESANPESYIGKICIFLVEIEKTLLNDSEVIELHNIQSMAKTCGGLLWITHGGSATSELPPNSLGPGLMRSLRNEHVGRQFVSLDLDPLNSIWSIAASQAIIHVLRAAFNRPGGSSAYDGTIETEYAERDGRILIPRLVKDVVLDENISQAARGFSTVPGMQAKTSNEAFHQPNYPLIMDLEALKDTGKLAFDLDLRPSAQRGCNLPENMVHLLPKAYGLGLQHALAGYGQLKPELMALECSGIIQHVGVVAASHGYKPGDRVFCLLQGPFASHASTEWTNVIHMPSALSFEEAASLPVSFSSALIGLRDEGRLKRDQSVLIHNAAGSVGQAAIMIAQHFGATIFATASTPEKRELIVKKYDISSDRVFSSRDVNFVEALLSATSARGVDLVLNTLSGSLAQASFDILAPLGRFVHIGMELDFELRPAKRQASFASVDLPSMMHYRKEEIQRTLAEVVRLAEDKTIAPAWPLNAYPIAEAAEPLQRLYDGTITGKSVLSCSESDTVPILPQRQVVRLSQSASYLIVGDAKNICYSVMAWMADHGAKSLIFLSYGSLNAEEMNTFVEEMRDTGCMVRLITCDSSDPASLEQALVECQRDEMRPIRGLVQAEPQDKISMFEDMTIDEYKASVAKVTRTRNLHSRFSQVTDLDFFIIFSSTIGILGGAGQSGYAAGCAYQDELAHWRVARGLPCVSIDLGPVKIATNASEALEIAKSPTLGHRPVSEDTMLKLLEAAITSPHRAQIIAGLNTDSGAHWNKDGPSPLAREARFAALRPRPASAQNEAAGSADSAESLANRLTEVTSHAEAERLVGLALAQTLANSFSVAVDEVDLAQPPGAHGVDSLVATELRDMLRVQAGAEVSSYEIMQSASLAALGALAAEKSAFVKVAGSS